MKLIIEPSTLEFEALSMRPQLDSSTLYNSVRTIFDRVKQKGDAALFDYTQQFDGVLLSELRVNEQEIEYAETAVSTELKTAIELAYSNIHTFHKSQQETPKKIDTLPGVQCWRQSVGIEKVGLYIPGGTAPLFSTLLMLAIPASIAGCKDIVLCTPPQKDGTVHPAILYAAKRCGLTHIFKIGGAQAIAAMVFGTSTILKTYKLFGPGNQYVTAAKQLALQYGVAIDMPAGPSEVLVYADETSIPSFVAADLLSQAEHGNDSQVVLVCPSESVVNTVLLEIEQQTKVLSRKGFVSKALENSKAIVINDTKQAMAFINAYAPEHLILSGTNYETLVPLIINAGSVFLGNYAPESVGDYASGTNHTLPTNGFAKQYSGVSLDSFVKKITFQHITSEGLKQIGNTVEVMAAAEQLDAHKNAVSIRLNTL